MFREVAQNHPIKIILLLEKSKVKPKIPTKSNNKNIEKKEQRKNKNDI